MAAFTPTLTRTFWPHLLRRNPWQLSQSSTLKRERFHQISNIHLTACNSDIHHTMLPAKNQRSLNSFHHKWIVECFLINTRRTFVEWKILCSINGRLETLQHFAATDHILFSTGSKNHPKPGSFRHSSVNSTSYHARLYPAGTIFSRGRFSHFQLGQLMENRKR
jgi:hypothetical protein